MKQAILDLVKEMDGMLIGFIVSFATIKIILNPKSRAFRAAMATYFISVPVGVLGALIAQEWGMQNATSIGIGCVLCLVSEKLVMFIIGFDFEDTLREWVNKKFK